MAFAIAGGLCVVDARRQNQPARRIALVGGPTSDNSPRGSHRALPQRTHRAAQ